MEVGKEGRHGLGGPDLRQCSPAFEIITVTTKLTGHPNGS